MRHDLADYLPEMSLRDKLATWLRFYWWPSRWFVGPLANWWQERRYGPCPPIEKDRVAHHLGLAPGIPACTDGPVCAEHGWPLSPLVDRGGVTTDEH